MGGEFAATTTVGNDHVRWQCISDVWRCNAKARLPSVDSLTSAIPQVHPRDKSLLQSGSQQLD